MKMMQSLLITLLALSANAADGQSPYEKLVYKPISAEAEKLGRLKKYQDIPTQNVTLQLGELRMVAKVPTQADAYDPLPITYTISGDCDADDLIAVEGTAFEDAQKRDGQPLYDLVMPGTMKLKIEYLGSQTGINDPNRPKRLTTGSEPGQFPPYTLEPFVRSGNVKQGNHLFFKFRITNVGDTILDAEGFGGWMCVPTAMRVKEDGSQEPFGKVWNIYQRHIEYLYPGESYETWVLYQVPGGDPNHYRTLPPGKYVLRYEAQYRYNREWIWEINMWGGKPWFYLEVPIEVTENGGDAPVEAREVFIEQPWEDRMTRYVRSFEEFMTAFDVWDKDELKQAQSGTLHLQVAPWTKQVVLKLIGNGKDRITSAAVPVEVNSDNLDIKYNPDNPFVVTKDEIEQPAFCTQSMVAMRANANLDPQADRLIRDRLRSRMEDGVNVQCTTSGDWHQGQIYAPTAYVGEVCAESFKFHYDVAVREVGMPIFGWGLFPPKTTHSLGTGGEYWKQQFNIPTVATDFTYSSHGELDVAHPDFPKAYAGTILWNYKRWGDFWYRTKDGDVIIDVEDSWGWLRDDINVRYYLGEHALAGFHKWVKKKYGTIARVNEAWGSDYKNFNEIDPQADQGNEGVVFGVDLTRLGPVYNRDEHPFHDWSPAIDDWDVFRTELRCKVYRKILRYVRTKIPNAQINIRTEGSVVPVTVPADSESAHLRHVYHIQRRQALVSEVLQREKVFKYHSDYTTLPYTESEWRYLLQRLTAEGIRGNYLPQFCTARDMVPNKDFGRDFSRNYGYDHPQRVVMVHRLQAAYPVWRIMYEEGHCPGTLWEDYMCDGFVTETQKQELRLLRRNLNAAK